MNRPYLKAVGYPPSERGLLFEDLLRRNIRIRLRVTGRSMHPYIKSGERVYIHPAKAVLGIGTVILFKNHAGHLMLHRIVRKRSLANGGALFQTKGDGNWTLDTPISREQIIGEAFAIEWKRTPESIRIINLQSPWRNPLNKILAMKSLIMVYILKIKGNRLNTFIKNVINPFNYIQ